MRSWTVGLPIGAILLCLCATSLAGWDESRFSDREPVVFRPSPASADLIGELRSYVVRQGDTLLDVARFFDLGINEITAANPGIDMWIPPEGEVLVIPTAWILPRSSRRGIVVNIPEMRLYYFRSADPKVGREAGVITFPVGLGRDEWKTPQGSFTIRGKTVNPTWVLPESIKEERRRDRGYSEDFIPGGDPENPLGKYRLELSMPLYALHGTNKPWGVGMQVSHGCIRLYPEDIEKLFGMVRVGTPGAFIYEPIKVAVVGEHVFVEAHPDIYKMLDNEKQTAIEILSERRVLGRVDRDLLDAALAARAGIPVDVTSGR